MMERIAVVVAIVVLLFLLGRLSSRIRSKHTENEDDPESGDHTE